MSSYHWLALYVRSPRSAVQRSYVHCPTYFPQRNLYQIVKKQQDLSFSGGITDHLDLSQRNHPFERNMKLACQKVSGSNKAVWTCMGSKHFSQRLSWDRLHKADCAWECDAIVMDSTTLSWQLRTLWHKRCSDTWLLTVQFKLREALFCLSEILSIKVFIPGNMELKVPTLECTLFSTLAPATATTILCNSIMQTLE